MCNESPISFHNTIKRRNVIVFYVQADHDYRVCIIGESKTVCSNVRSCRDSLSFHWTSLISMSGGSPPFCLYPKSNCLCDLVKNYLVSGPNRGAKLIVGQSDDSPTYKLSLVKPILLAFSERSAIL